MTDTKQVTINNSSDVGITCGYCGSTFTGQARYYDEVMQMYTSHWRQIHEITECIEIKPPIFDDVIDEEEA